VSDRRPTTKRYTPALRRNSLTAAAEVLTGASRTKGATVTNESWQTEAWRMYDAVGELRFGVGWLANALSRVNLIAAAPPDSAGDEPTPIDPTEADENGNPVWTPGQIRAVELTGMVAGGISGQGQMLGAFGTYLSLVGVAYLVAEPSLDDPEADSFETWNVASNEQLRQQMGSTALEMRAGPNDWRKLHPNALVVKVWRKHPNHDWLADSPVRATLGVLRQILLLQAHIDSSANSRLIGAGLVILPDELRFPASSPAGDSDGVDGDDEDITEALVRIASAAKADPASPAAQVPLTLQVPGEFVDKVKHLRFGTDFDSRVMDLLDKAIRRLALGMDMPPEVLTGVGGMNHWGAWQVEETAITLHVEPLAEMVCHGLTEGWLRSVLEAEGFDPDEAMVWYDASELQSRPDRSAKALDAFDRNELGASGLLRELGLSGDDQIDPVEKRERLLLSVARGAPTLAPPILNVLGYLSDTDLSKFLAVTADTAEAVGSDEPVADTEPGTQPAPADGPPTEPASAALVAACDQIAWRAFERAGSKLVAQVGKRAGNAEHSSILADIEPAHRHTKLDVTQFADLDFLLADAWTQVPAVADRHDIDPATLTAALRSYCRAMLAAGHPHDHDRLADALGYLHPAD